MRSVLGDRNFRLLFIGLCVSMFGESVLLLALAVWVKDLTGADGAAGATIFAIVGPMVFAPVVGWVVDRFRRRPCFIVTNLLTALILVPLLSVRTRADVWVIYAVGVLYGLSYIAVSAVLNGLIKEIVPGDRLPDANGVLQTVRQGLRLVGPLAGAGLYAGFGGWAVVVVGAAGFLVAAAAVAVLRIAETVPQRSQLRWLAEVGMGLRHLAEAVALRRAVVGLALYTFTLGLAESLVFAYVDRGLHRPPSYVGVFLCVQGIGGLCGGLVAAGIVRRLGELGALALGVGVSVPACLALTYPSLWLGAPALVVFGFGFPLALVGFSTLLQRSTRQELLGRVGAACDAVISGPQAVSIGLGAVLVGIVDYRLLFAVMAVAGVGPVSYLWLGRRLCAPTPGRRSRAEPATVGVSA